MYLQMDKVDLNCTNMCFFLVNKVQISSKGYNDLVLSCAERVVLQANRQKSSLSVHMVPDSSQLDNDTLVSSSSDTPGAICYSRSPHTHWETWSRSSHGRRQESVVGFHNYQRNRFGHKYTYKCHTGAHTHLIVTLSSIPAADFSYMFSPNETIQLLKCSSP